MAIDAATVKKVARLARIRVADAELEPLAGELSGILAWIEQLNEVNVDDVEPLSGGAQMALRQREDQLTDGDIAEKILANAPDRIGNFFAVPKVVE